MRFKCPTADSWIGDKTDPVADPHASLRMIFGRPGHSGNIIIMSLKKICAINRTDSKTEVWESKGWQGGYISCCPKTIHYREVAVLFICRKYIISQQLWPDREVSKLGWKLQNSGFSQKTWRSSFLIMLIWCWCTNPNRVTSSVGAQSKRTEAWLWTFTYPKWVEGHKYLVWWIDSVRLKGIVNFTDTGEITHTLPNKQKPGSVFHLSLKWNVHKGLVEMKGAVTLW